PRGLVRLVQRWIDLRAGHGKESYNVKKVTKVKTFCSGRLYWNAVGVRGSEPLPLNISLTPGFSQVFWLSRVRKPLKRLRRSVTVATALKRGVNQILNRT